MCSICGIIDYSGREDNKKILKNMAEKTHKVCCDPAGLFSYAVNNKVFTGMFGGVSDLKESEKPTTAIYKGIRYTVVLDGELYNKAELISDVTNILGYSPFESFCEDEVLLWTYILYGGGTASRLDGVFAFAIYSEAVYPGRNYAPRMFLARDRLGVKPLYYSETAKGEFLFASEIKSLLSHPSVSPVVDRHGFWQLFYLSPVFLPGTTVYRDIMELEPGCCAFLDCREENNGRIMKKVYWQLNAKECNISREEADNNVYELMKSAVKKRLIGEECAVLSGRPDFFAAAVIAADDCNGFLPAYTPVSEEISESPVKLRSDEIINDAFISQLRLSNQNIFLSLSQNADGNMRKVLSALDYPGIPDTDSLALVFYAEVEKKHTAAISGGFFDDIFGESGGIFEKSGMLKSFFPWIKDPYSRIELVKSELSEVCDGFNWLADRFSDSKKECRMLEEDGIQMKEARINTYIYLKYIIADRLKRTECIGRQNSLDIRLPFADHRLVEYVYNLPWEYKYGESYNPIYPEELLKRIIKRILPEQTPNYSTSHSSNLVRPGCASAFRNLLLERLSDKESALAGILDMKKVSDVLYQNEAPRSDRLVPAARIMAWLYMTDIWMDEYKIILSI